MKDQNGNAADTATESFVPHFNHSYHPVAPGYSITARSLSTKFREELKYIHLNHIYFGIEFFNEFLMKFFFSLFILKNSECRNATDENAGRFSPERPSSPVLVPGILKNNVAFFENLRNK